MNFIKKIFGKAKEITESAEPKQIVIKAPKGMMFFKRGWRGRTFLRRVDHSVAENTKIILKQELKRLSWPTRHLEVIQAGESFFVDIGPLRGLEPNAMYSLLQTLPSYCGHKEILRNLAKLEERVCAA